MLRRNSQPFVRVLRRAAFVALSLAASAVAADDRAVIDADCSRKYPRDREMQSYCAASQDEARGNIQQFMNFYGLPNAESPAQQILDFCIDRYGNNFLDMEACVRQSEREAQRRGTLK